MTPPVIVATGVSHRDVELASLWVRWVNFLCTQPGGDNSGNILLVTYTKRVAAKMGAVRDAFVGTYRGEFKTYFAELPDEDESGYPKSASHLFLRTMEIAEEKFPGSAVLWCEPDTVAMKPTWFAELAAEYVACEKPFMGLLVGAKTPHLSGNACYPADWRLAAPSLAAVLSAPDSAHWGRGKGQPWDVHCAVDTVPQMHQTKLIFQIWKERGFKKTKLAEIPPATCLFHQCKLGQVVRDLAERDYPGKFKFRIGGRRFYMLLGHESRFTALGHPVKFTWSLYDHGWRSAVCSDELTEAEANTLAMSVGRFGLSEISEDEFIKVTSRPAA